MNILELNDDILSVVPKFQAGGIAGSGYQVSVWMCKAHNCSTLSGVEISMYMHLNRNLVLSLQVLLDVTVGRPLLQVDICTVGS